MAQQTTLVGAFLDQKKRDGCKPSTMNKISTNLKAFFLRNDLSLEMTVGQFKRLNNEVFQKHLDMFDGSTHNSLLVMLNAVRKFAGMKKLDRKKRKTVDKPALDLDESEVIYQKMKAACKNDRERALLVLMRHGGLREGEIVLLKAEDFKFFTDYVKMHFFRPKTGTWGDLVIHDGIKDLEQYVKEKCDLLFPITTGAVWWIMNNITKRAGVTWNPHKFRHFRATELGKDGMFTKWDIDTALGWSHKTNTAAVYVNLSVDETNKKLMREGGVDESEDSKKEREKIDKLRCRRCGAVLGKDEIASGRCPVCQASTKLDDIIVDLKSREDMQAEMDAMKKQMAEMMVVMQKGGLYPAMNADTNEAIIVDDDGVKVSKKKQSK